MALGTVGGITKLHPTVKFCHELLGIPRAEELMINVAAAGLSQNFGAVRSLVTTLIQKGHLKMHLLNILNQLEATDQEKEIIRKEFETKTGKPFSYEIAGNVFSPSRTKYNIGKKDFEKALNHFPLDGPGEISNLVRGSAYIWAVLHDRRIRQGEW